MTTTTQSLEHGCRCSRGSLIERLRYHQAQAASLIQQIAGNPCDGVIVSTRASKETEDEVD